MISETYKFFSLNIGLCKKFLFVIIKTRINPIETQK